MPCRGEYDRSTLNPVRRRTADRLHQQHAAGGRIGADAVNRRVEIERAEVVGRLLVEAYRN